MPVAGLKPRAASIYLPRTARVLSVRSLTALEKHFVLAADDGSALGHQPGQFVQVSIPGVGECPISICSSPTRPETFELTVRRVGEVTSAIHQLRAGDEVGIRGPLGRGFDMRQFRGRDVLVASGGCGLAPARSVIHSILDRRGEFGAFYVLYGARSPADLLFRDELAEWAADGSVQCLVTVDQGDESWTGRTGVVTRLFDELPQLRARRTVAAVIGPPVMFRFVLKELLGRGIPQGSVYCSLERRMKCGIGKCGHCQVNHLYACMDGPVFRCSDIAEVREALT